MDINNFNLFRMDEYYNGFSGVTHWLLSLFFFFIMWLIPVPAMKYYIGLISENIVFVMWIMLMIGGAAMLNDLDSSPIQEGGSTAIYQLGVLGYGLSVLCVIISGVIYSVCHTKADDKPKSQHRMFFHTLIPAIILVGYTLLLPRDAGNFLETKNFGVLPVVFFAALSCYLGSQMLFYRLFKLFGKQKYTQFVSLVVLVGSLGYMLTCDLNHIIIISYTVALGYVFHILGDLMTQGGAPVLFPIPLPLGNGGKIQLWHKFKILGPLSIVTGGAVNIILNFVLMIADVALYVYIFIL